MIEALALSLRLFVRWFISAFLAWVIKGAFDATVSPWLERPLNYIATRSRAARDKVRQKVAELRVSYAEFDATYATAEGFS